MKTNIFVGKAAVASLLLAQMISCAWSSSHDVEEGPFANTLPEIQTTVCMELPIQDLGRIAQVSKALNAASNADAVWRNRIPDAETKADVMKSQPVVSYISGGSKEIKISHEDVIDFFKIGKLVVDGTTYACARGPDESFKSEFLHLLREFMLYSTGTPLRLDLAIPGIIRLYEAFDFARKYIIHFATTKENISPLLLKNPKQKVDLETDHAAHAKCVHDILLILDENYEDLEFYEFWGDNAPFEYLKVIANNMSSFCNAAPDTEKKIAAFLSAKYAQFNAEYPGDDDAAAYRTRLQTKGLWQESQ